MEKWPLIFASRDILARHGLSPSQRRFTGARQRKLESFQELVSAYPQVYGKMGSDNWIRGLLTQLNEPGVVAWDDVLEWLELPEVKELGKANPKRNISKEKLQEAIKSSVEKGALPKEKFSRLKHAIIRIERCEEAEELLLKRKSGVRGGEIKTGNSGGMLEMVENASSSSEASPNTHQPGASHYEQIVSHGGFSNTDSPPSENDFQIEHSGVHSLQQQPSPPASEFVALQRLLNDLQQVWLSPQVVTSNSNPQIFSIPSTSQLVESGCSHCCRTHIENLAMVGELLVSINKDVGILRQMDADEGHLASQLTQFDKFLRDQCIGLHVTIAATLTCNGNCSLDA